jgi:sialate O-acetylesterase
MIRTLAIFAVLGVFIAVGHTAPQPSALFSDHAVLQRGQPIPVWGTASPGERITVKYRGTNVTGVADGQGKWKVVLPAMTAGPGEDLVIEGQTTFRASDVGVGDVWICSGQSNMELAVEHAQDAAEIESLPPQPWLREIKVPHQRVQKPQENFDGKWIPASSQTVGKFSAVAYQFVRHLYANGDVPVGILNLSYGGTMVEAWMSPEALASSKSGQAVTARWAEILKAYPQVKAHYDAAEMTWQEHKKAADQDGKPFTEKRPIGPIGPGHYSEPSCLHFGMVAAVAGYPAAGFIWYQGESNVLHPDEYAELLNSYLKEIRTQWQSPGLPLFIAQLPMYDEAKFPNSWSGVRAAQAQVADELPNAYLAVLIDIGNPTNKHPTNKTEAGRRLALLAKRVVFGEKIPAEAPTVKGARKVGESVELKFETQGADLVLRGDPKAPKAFEIAGANGVFAPAEVVLKDVHSVTLSAPGITNPTQVRYLSYNTPTPILFTKDGIPARPFNLKTVN